MVIAAESFYMYFANERKTRQILRLLYSGVVGETEEFDSARLTVVVIFSIFVITGVGQ